MSTGGREITRPAGNYFENKLLLNPEKWALNIYLKEKKKENVPPHFSS